MKKPTLVGRSTPPYNYTYHQGVLKKRRLIPAVLYMLSVSLPMSAAVFMASLQVHQTHQPSKANLAATASVAKQPVNQSKIAQLANPSDNQDAKLQDLINQFVADHSDHNWSIQIQGLNGDERTASYAPQAKFNSASIYKLLMMYPLMQKTPISQWGQVSVDVVGSSSSLANCATAMLRISDNDCGDAIGNYVGWSYADAQLKTIGLSSTNLNNPGGPTTTAADTTYFLQGLYDGKWFDGATRSFILNVLGQQTLRAGIPTGCGRHCSVADKTGDLQAVRHDAGIVRYSGGAYVLSIFTNGASYSQIAQLAGQVQAYMAAN